MNSSSCSCPKSPAIDPASIEFFDKEMFTELGLGDRREADLVARVAIDGRPAFCLVHVEHQAQHDDVFARRMFRYWNILYERYDLPVYPIAVFSYSTRQVIPEGYEVTTLGFTPLAFKFRAIHLKRLAWRDFARRENPVAAALMARMRVPKRERPRVKLACLRLLANLRACQGLRVAFRALRRPCGQARLTAHIGNM